MALVDQVVPAPVITLPVSGVKVAGATCIVLDINEARLAFCRERMGVPHTIPARGDGSELEALRLVGTQPGVDHEQHEVVELLTLLAPALLFWVLRALARRFVEALVLFR